jgi:integrase
LRAYAFPKIGGMRVDHISTAELLNVLQPIWLAKPETARRVRQRIGLTLDWAKAKGFRALPSPTREIGTALPKQKRTKRHHLAMPYAGVPGFIHDVLASEARPATKAAMEFLILTAGRTSEVLQARWDEIDFTANAWTIPGKRMKSGRAHVVPLSERALEILRDRKADHSGKGDFIFETSVGEPASNMTLLMAMRRMKLEAVPHGFRSSFRDWAAEAAHGPRDVAEAALAHAVRDQTEAAYKRTDFLEQRRKLMERWADHCAGAGGKIIPFERAANTR